LQPATFTVVDASHPSTSSLPARWTFTEEVYSFRSDPRQTNVTLLLSVDESSYTDAQRGSRPYSQGNPHPIAWFREASTPGLDLGNASYATGRAWYTSLGHSIETWQNTTFLGHVQGGCAALLSVWLMPKLSPRAGSPGSSPHRGRSAVHWARQGH
jgi:type 1 glutamine amidotransferase